MICVQVKKRVQRIIYDDKLQIYTRHSISRDTAHLS